MPQCIAETGPEREHNTWSGNEKRTMADTVSSISRNNDVFSHYILTDTAGAFCRCLRARLADRDTAAAWLPTPLSAVALQSPPTSLGNLALGSRDNTKPF